MKKIKNEKGITLVALIITIIVLLILAVVAINAVQDDGIIEYGKNARDDYQKAQTNESALLGNYTNYIKENIATVKIITFTIQNAYGGVVAVCEAEEGMDFYTWCNSEYNETSYIAEERNSGISYSDGDSIRILKHENTDSYGGGALVYGSDKIEQDKIYYQRVEFLLD